MNTPEDYAYRVSTAVDGVEEAFTSMERSGADPALMTGARKYLTDLRAVSGELRRGDMKISARAGDVSASGNGEHHDEDTDGGRHRSRAPEDKPAVARS